MKANMKNNSHHHRAWSPRHTRREDGDIHESCPGISGRLFQRLSVKSLRLLHVDGLHFLGEAHFSVSLRQSDQRLQLPGIRGHHPSAAADLPHVHVGLRVTAWPTLKTSREAPQPDRNESNWCTQLTRLQIKSLYPLRGGFPSCLLNSSLRAVLYFGSFCLSSEIFIPSFPFLNINLSAFISLPLSFFNPPISNYFFLVSCPFLLQQP